MQIRNKQKESEQLFIKLSVRNLVVSDLQSATKGFIMVTTYVQK